MELSRMCGHLSGLKVLQRMKKHSEPSLKAFFDSCYVRIA